MSKPSTFKLQLVRLRDHLPLNWQRVLNRLVFHLLLPKDQRKLWDERLIDVTNCADNSFLPRHPNAGQVIDGIMTMHNGLRIHAGSYYGWGSQRILEKNRGCHEPQEERVFAQVLELLPPRAVMIELGAYWAFYSLWFASKVPDAENWMVEPEAGNMEKGIANFTLNQKRGRFIRAFVGADHKPNDELPFVSIDGLMEEHRIERVNMLHCDIQGWELDMLRGAERAIDGRLVDHIFISTHSNELHRDCVKWLLQKGYCVHQDIDLDATFSHDGLIVAQNPHMNAVVPLKLDRRNAGDTTA